MTSLENCNAIQNAKRLNQDYLYINKIIEDEYDLGAELGRLDSAFGIQDLEHYEEEFVTFTELHEKTTIKTRGVEISDYRKEKDDFIIEQFNN